MAWDVHYYAWNTSSNDGQTGDGANHTLAVEVEGSEVTGLTPTELGNGQYKVSPSDAQLPEGSSFSVNGSSSTADVEIIGQAGFRPETERGTDGANTTTPPTAATVADAVWDEAQADHTTADTFGARVQTTKTNTDTLLSRITADLFSGITKLAEWLGLLAGKQTGNSTARTEIRATGAGSGTYDETTDSQEAIRDRGDAEWITATGFAVPGDAMDFNAAAKGYGDTNWATATGFSTFDPSTDQVDVGSLDGSAIQQSDGYIHARDENGNAIQAPLHQGDAQGATGTTITLASAASDQNDAYNGCVINIPEGQGSVAGQHRVITDYDGASREATIHKAWSGTNPSAGTHYEILPGYVQLAEITHEGATVPTVTTLTGHTPQTGDNYARLGAPAGASVSADIAENQTDLDAILTDLTDGTVVVGTVSDKTGYALTAAERNSVADATLTRDVSNVDGSLGDHMLGTLVMAGLESKVNGSGNLEIYQTDGTTVIVTKTLTTDANADPITGVE